MKILDLLERLAGQFRDALDAVADDLGGRMRALETAHADLKALPVPKDGASVTVEEVLPALTEQVRAYLETLPAPQDGKSVTLEEVGVMLLPHVERTLKEMQAQWALDFERRAQEVFQRAIERISAPNDGLDGLGFDDLTVEHDGERAVTLRFVRGDQVKEFPLVLPLVIDRGYWKEGSAVKQFDGVTFGGSYWIAQKDTETKPDIGNPDWRLAVKKGRDGKDFTK